jgi:hypothetical protein
MYFYFTFIKYDMFRYVVCLRIPTLARAREGFPAALRTSAWERDRTQQRGESCEREPARSNTAGAVRGDRWAMAEP